MYLIGIAGGSGSGKSTFAQKITELVNHQDVAHIHQDWYYLAQQPREQYVHGKPNFDHPSSFDWPLMTEQLQSLKAGRSVDRPVYDFKTSSRQNQTQRIGPCKVAIFEGIHALWNEELRALMDLKIFLQVDADIRFIRRLHRDVRERGRDLDSVINQYYDTVRPMHRQFLESTSQFADLLVGEETDIPATVIATRVMAVLEG